MKFNWLEAHERFDDTFSVTKELIAGYWLWQGEIDGRGARVGAALPGSRPPGEESELEIRPVFEAEDFAANDPTGKIREQEEELRKTLEAQKK